MIGALSVGSTPFIVVTTLLINGFFEKLLLGLWNLSGLEYERGEKMLMRSPDPDFQYFGYFSVRLSVLRAKILCNSWHVYSCRPALGYNFLDNMSYDTLTILISSPSLLMAICLLFFVARCCSKGVSPFECAHQPQLVLLVCLQTSLCNRGLKATGIGSCRYKVCDYHSKRWRQEVWNWIWTHEEVSTAAAQISSARD